MGEGEGEGAPRAELSDFAHSLPCTLNTVGGGGERGGGGGSSL